MHRDESLARSNEIDQICDEFEQACRAGHARRIEEVLAENPGVDRARLLRELLLIELEIRQQQGEPASADDYVDRFPSDTDVVGAAVETILLRHDPAANEETVDVSMNAGEETYVPKDAAEAETIVPGSKTEPGQESNDATGGKLFGDYELLHEIARGGMGVVYKARQTKLNRIVALKMIKSGELAGDEEVKRFHAEAEAAAALDHPGIVPIYEVGQHNDQHFFSMGFVDGAGLDAQLKEGPLPPKDAASLIKTIAEAVQYAHDKGIVHRDLKPANVLLADAAHPVEAQSGVTDQREPGRAAPGHNDSRTTVIENAPNAARAGTARLFAPKITDFGLAKNIAGDSGMTATGQVLGTPSYMPPEQAAGKIEQVGPLADVYSLGAMLYATLTGRPPFQSANVMETLKQVLEREPVSPSQLNPAVDKDLETIVLKCLEKDAAKRYPTARDFANDLECYLTGKPISARPISRPARLWRWCKRNPLGATVAGLLLFLAIAGPAVAIHQIETNRQLDNALAGEKIATATAQQKEQETATALAKVKVALANEQAALKRKDQALLETEKSIDAYVEVVKNAELLKDARFKPLLTDLLKDALKHYTRFVEEHQDEQDEETRVRLASALFEIGWLNNQKGSLEEAVKAYRQSLRIRSQLTRSNPSKAFQNELSRCLLNLGAILMGTGKTDEAFDAFQQALKIQEMLARQNPEVSRYRNDLAFIHRNLGMLYRATGKFADATTSYRQSMRLQKQLVQEFPSAAQYQHGLAVSQHHVGNLHLATGKPTEAVAAYQSASKILEKLIRENQAEAEYQSDLAEVYISFVRLYEKTGEPAQALSFQRKALAVYELLVRQKPAVTHYQHGLATSHQSIANLYWATRKLAEAETAYGRALKIWEQLARENSTVTRYRAALAGNLLNLGVVYRASGKLAKAIVAQRRALKIHEQLTREDPDRVAHQQQLAGSHDVLGSLFRETNQVVDAVAAYRRALRIRERLVLENPTIIDFKTNLAGTHCNLSNLYRAIGKNEQALDSADRAIRLLSMLAKRTPKNVTARQFLRNSLWSRATTLERLARHRHAADAWRKALALTLDSGSKHGYFQQRLALALARGGQYAEATTLADQILRVTRNAVGVYTIVRVYALSANSSVKNRAGDTESRTPSATHNAKKAVAILKVLARSGFFKEPKYQLILRIDPDLDPLRKRDDFRAFAKSVGVELPAWALKPVSVTTAGAP